MKPILADDKTTLAALGVLAFALADVSHEALGHGLATLVLGDKAVLLCTCYFDSTGHYSKWIPAAGGLMNLAVGLAALGVLRLSSRLGPTFRYFLVLTTAFNLFFAFGYPTYSGVAQFGDWAAVISGLEPQWLWRLLLILVSVAGYYGTMKLLARAVAPFAGVAEGPTDGPPNKARMLRITLIPYVAAMMLACAAGALNPKGLITMLTSGLPAAGAAFGLTQLDHLLKPEWLLEPGWRKASPGAAGPLKRSFPWIIAAGVTAIFFIGVLGPGIKFR